MVRMIDCCEKLRTRDVEKLNAILLRLVVVWSTGELSVDVRYICGRAIHPKLGLWSDGRLEIN